MHTYQKLVTVSKVDLDENRHVNNVRYVSWVNEIALEHWTSKTSDAIRSQYFWVMIRHTIDYKSEAILNDRLRIETYVVKTEGLRSVRKVSFFKDATDTLVATSETTWCFMSQETKRPTRIPESIVTLFE